MSGWVDGQKANMVDIELAEPEDAQQQQRKKKKRHTIKRYLKEFACCVCATLDLIGAFSVVQNHYQNKWWDNCEAHGGHIVGARVTETFFTEGRVLRCEGLDDDDARWG
jgi:hypothetical protein